MHMAGADAETTTEITYSPETEGEAIDAIDGATEDARGLLTVLRDALERSKSRDEDVPFDPASLQSTLGVVLDQIVKIERAHAVIDAAWHARHVQQN